jgi:hypothetical protein
MIDPDNPDSWGKYFWITAHTMVSIFPENPTEEDKKYYQNHLESFQFTLPCIECRTNWKSLLENEMPITENALTNRYTLSKWLFDAHNHVNMATGKRRFSLMEFCKLYPHLLKGLRDLYPEDFKVSVAAAAMERQQQQQPMQLQKSPMMMIQPDISLGHLKYGGRSTWQRMMQQQNSAINQQPPKIQQPQRIRTATTTAAATGGATTGGAAPKPKKCGCNKSKK